MRSKSPILDTIDARAIGLTRLVNLGIATHRFNVSLEVVDHHGAMQAQDFAGVLWSIALRRSDKPTEASVRASLFQERVVRTWPMRGTLHLVHPASARWILQLLSPTQETATRSRLAQLELNNIQVDRCRAALAASLSDGEPRTRSEIYHILQDVGVATDDQRGYQLISIFAREQLICFGPDRGNQATYVLLDVWTNGLETRQPERPMEYLAWSYISSHGPVTSYDFARWAGVAIRPARAAFNANRSQSRVDYLGGVEFFSPANPASGSLKSNVYLLPGFDEFVLGYKDRSLFIDPLHLDRIVPGGNGVFRPTIVVDGRVVGTWSRTVTAKTVRVVADWWKAPSRRTVVEFEETAESYAAYLERTLVN